MLRCGHTLIRSHEYARIKYRSSGGSPSSIISSIKIGPSVLQYGYGPCFHTDISTHRSHCRFHDQVTQVYGEEGS